MLDAERFAVVRRACSAAPTYPAGGAGQGVGAAGLRRTPRRHHRLGVRPGLPRPADRLARRVGARPRGARQCADAADLERRRRLGRGVEPVGAQPDRCRDGAPRRAARRRRAGRRRRRRRRCPSLVEHGGHDRSPGWPATCRRWAGGPTGSVRGVDAGGLGAGRRQLQIANEHYRLRVDPARGGGGGVADRRRPRTDRRRAGRQRAGGLRRVPGAPAGGRGARGTCCPRGPWSARRASPPIGAGLPLRRSASGWSCAGASADCCATPRR